MNEKNTSSKHSMEESHDEEVFTQYLQGESRLSKIYQKTDTPAPADKLNASILAAAEKQASRNNWWANPGSWAATVAIVSLVGLLTHNLWQEEQDHLLKKPFQDHMEQQSFSAPLPATALKKPRSESKPESKSELKFEPELDILSRSQKTFQLDEKNDRQANINKDSRTIVNKDSRGLLFKSAPAPVLPAASGNVFSEQSDSVLEDEIKAIQTLSNQPADEEVRAHNEFSAEQQLLNIKKLLENNQLEAAEKLLARFKEIYPDYPIDPVILEHLSPH